MLALLYDVHGNLPALEAVIADAEAAGATRWVLGGDYALFGGWPAETVERLRELRRDAGSAATASAGPPTPTRRPTTRSSLGAIVAARAALGEATVAELASLPFARPDRRHADLPRLAGVRRALLRSRAAPRTRRAARGHRRAALVFGHTHLPFRRTSAGGVELVNPGSVGMPFDGDPRAAYALLTDDGRIEHRRVRYDHGASAERVRPSAREWSEVVAQRIERAAMDV